LRQRGELPPLIRREGGNQFLSFIIRCVSALIGTIVDNIARALDSVAEFCYRRLVP